MHACIHAHPPIYILYIRILYIRHHKSMHACTNVYLPTCICVHIHAYVYTSEEHIPPQYSFVDGWYIHRYRNTRTHALPPSQIFKNICMYTCIECARAYLHVYRCTWLHDVTRTRTHIAIYMHRHTPPPHAYTHSLIDYSFIDSFVHAFLRCHICVSSCIGNFIKDVFIQSTQFILILKQGVGWNLAFVPYVCSGIQVPICMFHFFGR